MVFYFVQLDVNLVYHELAERFFGDHKGVVTRQGDPMDRGVWQEERPVKYVRFRSRLLLKSNN